MVELPWLVTADNAVALVITEVDVLNARTLPLLLAAGFIWMNPNPVVPSWNVPLVKDLIF